MHPVLFKIGPLNLYSYGVMLAAAFFTAVFLARRAAKEARISPDVITDLGLVLLFSGIAGARLLYVILNIQDYVGNPFEILMLSHGGLAFYGGALAAFIAGIVYAKLKGLSIYKLGDLIAPYAALGQAIGRIGCFLNGCCFGKSEHPAQIYSSLALIFIYGFLRLFARLKVKPGVVLVLYGVLYSVKRFFMEFLRDDNIIILFGLTFSQFISVIVFIVCILILSQRILAKE